jgi:hypothetical protein
MMNDSVLHTRISDSQVTAIARRRRPTRKPTEKCPACEAVKVPELAGRLHIPKLYKIDSDRSSVVELLESAIEASGGRVLYSSASSRNRI